MLIANVNRGGTGGDNLNIALPSGFGTPDWVWVKRFSGITGSNNPVGRTSLFSGDSSKDMGAALAPGANNIQGFAADQYQVGTDNRVNRAATTYLDFACRDNGAGDFSVFTYTGNGTSPRAVGAFGFTPDVAIVIPMNGVQPWWRTSVSAAGMSQLMTGAPAANQITAFGAGTITVAGTLNTNLVVYNVAVWRAPAVFVVAYTGTGVNPNNIPHTLGAAPHYAFVQSTDATNVQQARVKMPGSGVNSAELTGINAINGYDVDASNILLTAGPTVNSSGKTYMAALFGPTTGGARLRTMMGVGT